MKLLIILAILAVCQSFRFPSRRPGLPQLLGMKQIKFALRRRRPIVNSINYVNDHQDVEHVNDEAMKEDLQKIINAFKAMINQPIHQWTPPPFKVPLITGNTKNGFNELDNATNAT